MLQSYFFVLKHIQYSKCDKKSNKCIKSIVLGVVLDLMKFKKTVEVNTTFSIQ